MASVVTDLQQQAACVAAIARADLRSCDHAWAYINQAVAASLYAASRHALAGFFPGKPLGGAGVSRSDKPPASDLDALTDPQP